MQTLTEPIRMETPYGPLFVSVTSAEEHRHYDVDNKRDVNVLRPRLYVASDPAFEADPDADDHWLIRKRQYGVLRLYNFRDLTHLEYADGRRGDRWHAEDNPNRGGYRNEKRGPVFYGTATWRVMDSAVLKALDDFADAHPQWGALSLYLLHKSKSDVVAMEITRAEAELAALNERAEALRETRMSQLAATPDDLLDLIKP